ncbi:MAG: hypothetical protein B6D59_03360 [Campylobacteraceae bacterium 4484_4]|nr:MAG: hypothetical protein B6D59_03360 [Campylobacteraceae bacterium 4484_4]
MGRVYRYIVSNFLQTFSSIFFTLFFLVSVIFFIRISRLTSVFNVTFSDLGQMYLFMLPEITIFTLPITFFISVALTIFKMSRDNETIVLFALGLDPRRVARLFFLLSLLVSVFLLFNAIVFTPLSKQLNKNFIEAKKLEAKINVRPSEFGQKFDQWNLFVNRSGPHGYKDIVLYNPSVEKGENFIIAKDAKIFQKDGAITLKLNDGRVFNFLPDELRQIDFKALNISYFPKIRNIRMDTVKSYWMVAKHDPKRAKDLSQAVLIALFPLVSYLFAISFGIANIRHESPNIYLHIFVVILAFYLMVYQVSLRAPFAGTIAAFGLFYAASALFFKRKILSRY